MAEFEQQSLDGILDGSEPKAPESEVKEAPAAGSSGEPPPAKEPKIEPLERPRRQDGTFKSKDELAAEAKPKEAAKEAPVKEEPAAEKPAPVAEKPAEAPKPQMDPQIRAFLAAAQDERRKRQDLERQLAEIRQKLPQTDADKPKTFWDDPEGHLAKQLQSVQERETSIILRTSEMMARNKYPDFQEKVDKFSELVQKTPGLAQQWLGAPDPGEFAYQTAKNHILLSDAGSIDAMRENIRKEERLKIEAELKTKADDLAKAKKELPGTLSSIKGGATQQKAEFTGPTSLDDILAKPKKRA